MTPIDHGRLPAYKETPDSTQWWVMCPDHGYWATHGGNIGPRVTHCPLCPPLTGFVAYPAGPEDPPFPSHDNREKSRDKVWNTTYRNQTRGAPQITRDELKLLIRFHAENPGFGSSDYLTTMAAFDTWKASL